MKARPKVLFCLLTAICIAAVFWSSLIGRTAISRFNLIQQLDVLSNPALQGTGLNVAWDPSACLQSIPKEVFVRQSLLRGQSPIWNPHSGCGQPIIADPANTVWAPLDLIFAPSASDQRLYNVGLVLKIILGGVFSYLFFLANGASPWAASSAAIGFALSVRVLRGVELATNFEMLPAIFLIFQNLPERPSWKQICLSALGLTLCYLSLHPEVFFVAVLSASFLWICKPRLAAAQDSSAAGDSSGAKRDYGSVLLARRLFFLCALASICLAMVAPFLFPFIEYLNHAHSYKYDGASIEFIPLAQFLFFLIIPRISGALFPGWVVLLGLPLGLLRFIKLRPASLALLVGLILFACRPAPLDLFLSRAPFSYLLPEYTLGTILLILCWAAALGLTELANLVSRPILQRVVLALVTFAVIIVPVIWFGKNLGALGLLHVSINNKFVTSAVLTLIGALLAILFLPPRFLFSKILLILLPVLNMLALWAPAKAELPLNKPMSLPIASSVALFQKLESFTDARIAACGSGVMPPSSNLLYGLEDLRTCSPLNNSRYLKFMQQMGATLGYCNMVELPFVLNHLIDVAGVDLIVSSSPLSSLETSNLNNVQFEQASISGHILPGMRLLRADSNYYAGAAEIKVVTQFRVHQNISGRYQAQVILCDEQLHEIWRGTPRVLAVSQSQPSQPSQQVSSAPGEQDRSHRISLNWDLPAPIKGVSRVRIILLVYDTWSSSFITPDGNDLSAMLIGNKLSLATFRLSAPAKIQTPDGHFALLDETSDLLRLYRNTKARPHAYLMHNVTPVKNSDEALQIVSNANFAPESQVVVESKTGDYKLLRAQPHASDGDEVKTIKSENTRLDFQCKTNSDAMFVLTDLIDPGWQAYLDGKRVDIAAANYLFRAVELPSGRHSVSFRYVPATFVLGLLLSLLAGLLLLVSWFRTGKRGI